MTDSDIKLQLFRAIDHLTGKELHQVYQLLMDVVSTSIVEKSDAEKEGLEAAYKEMAEDEQNGIRKFDEVEDWNFQSAILQDNKEEYGGYLSKLSENEYTDLRAAYEEMAEDEQNGKRNLDW